MNDIETGAFELADNLIEASKLLLAKLPDSQTWFVRIGHVAIDHFGARSLKLLRGYDLRIQTIEGSTVTIEALPLVS